MCVCAHVDVYAEHCVCRAHTHSPTHPPTTISYLLCTLTLLHHGHYQSLSLEAIKLKAGLVTQPLFIDSIIGTWQDAHHLHTTRIHTNVGTQGIADINGFGGFELPAAIGKGSGLVGERTHGAQINDIATELTCLQCGGWKVKMMMMMIC